MVKTSNFVIRDETHLSLKLRNVTNKRTDAFVWCSEPTVGARNEGMQDLNVALDGVTYPVELKVKYATIYSYNTTKLLRPSQIRFMHQLNKVGVYGYIGLGYMGTDKWGLVPVYTPDGITVEERGAVLTSKGEFDLAEAIVQSLKAQKDV